MKIPPVSPDETKVGAALFIALAGLLVPAVLVWLLVSKDWKANDIATIVGLFTGMAGTLVGSFLGVQVASSGKQQTQIAAEKAQELAAKALAALAPETASKIISEASKKTD